MRKERGKTKLVCHRARQTAQRADCWRRQQRTQNARSACTEGRRSRSCGGDRRVERCEESRTKGKRTVARQGGRGRREREANERSGWSSARQHDDDAETIGAESDGRRTHARRAQKGSAFQKLWGRHTGRAWRRDGARMLLTLAQKPEGGTADRREEGETGRRTRRRRSTPGGRSVPQPRAAAWTTAAVRRQRRRAAAAAIVQTAELEDHWARGPGSTEHATGN
eukprot:CAMPEP_0195568512 /NCGR_PEP_ID=MMETSP0814-20130614/2282_1 /TAXON_ID=97485 /ORGANISM="Prymnesium parvum, Strain Texoma1" /LENGTH=223 /DNA_ID=CAMNT_0040703815 /DNA_START=292 /DNA_END=963 /DNA_ORIENTATION=+